MSRLFLLGLNHKTAPVEVRERFALGGTRLGHALDYVRGVPGIRETAILSTCNRVEIYAIGDEGAAPKLFRAMADYHSFGAPRSLESHLYSRNDEEAAGHLFRVASGLDSLVLGEAEILGQVKGALENARMSGAAGQQLDELFRRAIACGKRARTETGISRGALSVGAAAVELAKQIFGSLKGHTVLILGAGKMSARVAQCLVSSGAHRVIVANRTFERAQELAQEFNDEGANAGSAFGAEAVTWEEFPSKLAQADIVIASTRAPHYVVTPAHLQATARNRRRSLLLIDIAVPRDIDPECNRFDDVFLFDIDDLQNVVEGNRVGRASEIARVETIINEETGQWTKWMRGSSAIPVVSALAQRANAVRANEVELALGKLEHLSERDREIIAAMGRSIANKLVHSPMAHLRNGGEGDAEAIARAFGLGGLNANSENSEAGGEK